MTSVIERIRTILEQRPDVELGFLYGSHATQRATRDSDLDIAIATSVPLSLDERVAIAETLSKEFQCEVDLVDICAAHGALLQEILTRGICFTKRNLPLYERLIKRMLMEKEDDSRFAGRAITERIQRWSRQIRP